MPGSRSPDLARRNVRLLYAYSIASRLQPHLAVWVVYLSEFRELTLVQVGVLEGFFWAVQIVSEIPTGAFADRFGRRRTFMLASVIEAVGILLFGLADGYALILLSYVGWSLGLSFRFGNAGAFLYDTLAGSDQSESYARLFGRNMAVGVAATQVGGVLGGVIGGWLTLQAPVLLGSVPFLFALVVAWRMNEPEPSVERAPRGYAATLRDGTAVMMRLPAVRYAILIEITLSLGLLAEFLLLQPFLRAHDVPVAVFGLFLAPLGLLGAGAALIAHRLVATLGVERVVGAAIIAVAGSFAILAMVDHILAFAGYVLIVGSLSAVTPALSAYVNDRTDSSIRATVLSIAPLGRAVTFTLAAPLLGRVADTGLEAGYAAEGATVLLLAGGLYLLWRRAERPPSRRPAAVDGVAEPAAVDGPGGDG